MARNDLPRGSKARPKPATGSEDAAGAAVPAGRASGPGEPREQQTGRGTAREDQGARDGDSPQPKTSGNRQPTFGKGGGRHKSK